MVLQLWHKTLKFLFSVFTNFVKKQDQRYSDPKACKGLKDYKSKKSTKKLRFVNKLVKKIDHRYPKKFRYVLKSKKSIFELIWTTKNTTFFQPGPAGVGYRLCPPLLLSPPSFERCKHNSACKVSVRYHSRFFVFVWHETMYAAVGNHHFFTIPCHRQTFQNY